MRGGRPRGQLDVVHLQREVGRAISALLSALNRFELAQLVAVHVDKHLREAEELRDQLLKRENQKVRFDLDLEDDPSLP